MELKFNTLFKGYLIFGLIWSLNACESPYRRLLDPPVDAQNKVSVDQEIEGEMGADLGMDDPDLFLPSPSTCDAQGPSRLYAVHIMKFALVDQGVSAGFNLDGEVSQLAGETGCGLADFVDAEGREGIDNQFAALVPILDPVVGQPLNASLARTISEKAFILLIEIQGLDDVTNDDNVDDVDNVVTVLGRCGE